MYQNYMNGFMNESDREEFWIELEAQNFADAIDELRTYIITTK
jgi:hypothetical protein